MFAFLGSLVFVAGQCRCEPCGCDPCPCLAAAVRKPAKRLLPVRSGKKGSKPLDFGLDASRLGKGPAYSLNGRATTRRDALQLIEAADPRIPDSSGKLRVVVIGKKVEREKVAHDFPSEWQPHLVWQEYEPDHWHVKDFPLNGKPGVWVMTPAGGVLHRQSDVEGGGQALGKAVGRAWKQWEKLRKPDPQYDPGKDPDLRKDPEPARPVPGVPPDLPKNIPWSVWVVAALGAAAFWFFGRRTA
jgi:hypothetical protein